jgi:hypothetical protein
MLAQQSERLRALWKSGRDKYRSFFVVLEEVRKEIGDDALPAWCRNELYIGLSVITQIAAVLGKVDEVTAKADLAAANKAEKEQKEAEVAAARKVREDAAHQRTVEQAAREAELAALKAKKAQSEVEEKKIKDNEKERQRKRADPKQRGAKGAAKRRKREVTTKLSDASLTEMIARYKKADALCAKGTDYWIEGSIAKAMVLCAARDKFTANDEFGEWLKSNGINLNKDDRAGLMGLGRLGEKRMQEIFASTDRRSYQHIWQDHKPVLKAVEN